jgi:hypothetical protein
MCELPPYEFDMRQRAITLQFDLAVELLRPSMLLKPKLFIDGNMWIALFGENIQDGVVGSGKSPEQAYAAFDIAWREPLKEAAHE